MTTKTAIRTALAASVVGAALASTPVVAQEEASALDVSANASIVSDYRFRGVSLNTEDFAAQGGVDATYKLGEVASFYIGNWNSSLNDDTGYGSYEVDLYTGFTGTMGAVGWKTGVIGYFYPDDSQGTDYYELQGEVSGAVGPATMAVGVFYAPKQVNYGDERGLYLYTSASAGISNTPLTVKATLGYEDNAFYNDKLDWSVGVSATIDMFTASVSYVDTNRATPYGTALDKDASDAAMVASIGVVF